jgi:hypothetical protein
MPERKAPKDWRKRYRDINRLSKKSMTQEDFDDKVKEMETFSKNYKERINYGKEYRYVGDPDSHRAGTSATIGDPNIDQYDDMLSKAKRKGSDDDYLDRYDFQRKSNPGKYANIMYNLAKAGEPVKDPLQQKLKLSRQEAIDVSSINKRDAIERRNASRMQGKGLSAAQASAHTSKINRQLSKEQEKYNFDQYQENKRVEAFNKSQLDKEIMFAKQSEARAREDYDLAEEAKNKALSDAIHETTDRASIDEQAQYMYGKDRAQWELDKDIYKSMRTPEFSSDDKKYGIKYNKMSHGARFGSGKYKMYPDGTIELK